MKLKHCIYCDKKKPAKDFSLEHIWPTALGGQYLEPFWTTSEVCKWCNNTLGVFVDGAFIKSWHGSFERAHAAHSHFQPNAPSPITPLLTYLGYMRNGPSNEDIDVWVGPRGAHVYHFRPKLTEDTWRSYAGGDPRTARKSGRAYLSLTTDQPEYIIASLKAFNQHFHHTNLFVTNLKLDAPFGNITAADPSSPKQRLDLAFIQSVQQKGKWELQSVVQVGAETRFMVKVGLAVGAKILGSQYLSSTHAQLLRSAMWERNYERRTTLGIKGSSSFIGDAPNAALGFLSFPGAWVLFIHRANHAIGITLITPQEKAVTTLIAEGKEYDPLILQRNPEGLAWIVSPSIGKSVGPLHPARILNYKARPTIDIELDQLYPPTEDQN